MGAKVKAVLYARTSTVLKQDPRLQLVAMREYATSKGIDIVREYADQVTGAKERRPGLDALIAAAKRKEFTILIVSAIDRVGRNCRHLLNLIDELHSYGVSLISLRENIDLSSALGKALFQILSAVAELEKNLISERIRVALASKKLMANETGWRCGRPRTVTDEVKDQIISLRKKGLSIRAIERALNKKVSHTVIGRVVKGLSTKPT